MNVSLEMTVKELFNEVRRCDNSNKLLKVLNDIQYKGCYEYIPRDTAGNNFFGFLFWVKAQIMREAGYWLSYDWYDCWLYSWVDSFPSPSSSRSNSVTSRFDDVTSDMPAGTAATAGSSATLATPAAAAAANNSDDSDDDASSRFDFT